MSGCSGWSGDVPRVLQVLEAERGWSPPAVRPGWLHWPDSWDHCQSLTTHQVQLRQWTHRPYTRPASHSTIAACCSCCCCCCCCMAVFARLMHLQEGTGMSGRFCKTLLLLLLCFRPPVLSFRGKKKLVKKTTQYNSNGYWSGRFSWEKSSCSSSIIVS